MMRCSPARDAAEHPVLRASGFFPADVRGYLPQGCFFYRRRGIHGRGAGRSGCVITAADFRCPAAREEDESGDGEVRGAAEEDTHGVAPKASVDDWQTEILRYPQDDIGWRVRIFTTRLLSELFDFAFDQVPLQHTQMLDEKNAVEWSISWPEGAARRSRRGFQRIRPLAFCALMVTNCGRRT